MPPDRAPITVLLVEDHLLVSEGLAAIINATGDLKVVGTAPTAAEAVRLATLQQPDVVVMDSHLPDASGADIAGRIREDQPAVPIIFLSADESEVAMIGAVRAGACAYLPKSRAIAAELGIGFTTVRGHVQNILEKLDAHSKLEALACAARFGLLDAA